MQKFWETGRNIWGVRKVTEKKKWMLDKEEEETSLKVLEEKSENLGGMKESKLSKKRREDGNWKCGR